MKRTKEFIEVGSSKRIIGMLSISAVNCLHEKVLSIPLLSFLQTKSKSKENAIFPEIKAKKIYKRTNDISYAVWLARLDASTS